MTMAKSAIFQLKMGADFPYDAGEEFWDGDGKTPPPAKDWAHAAARGILSDLEDRRGIKNELDGVDHETRAELVESLSEIIRQAHAAK